MDPFSEHTDDIIWSVLDKIELKTHVLSLSNKLETVISDNSTFSSGQKQLICLGRAILRNNKILILDEATANVDMKTDQTIQELIKRDFKNCTVLSIAHRLKSKYF